MTNSQPGQWAAMALTWL